MVQETYIEYPVFKGLQRPLEFMGLRGRYIWWGVGAVGGGIFAFIVGFLLFSVLVGFLTFVMFLGVGYLSIMVKQVHGLHSKRVEKGIFIFHHSIQHY